MALYSVISTKSATPDELSRTEDLDQWLGDAIVTNTPEQSAKCEHALADLGSILKDWVKAVGAARGLPSDHAAEAGAKMYTSGSYRMGLNEAGADIDIICVVPRHVSREDFFGDVAPHGLHAVLKEHPKVTNLVPVPDAAVPIMKMFFDEIDIDFLLAPLELSSIPENLDLMDDMLLRNVDQQTRTTINGPRVTNLIAEIVAPSRDTFRQVLKAVRIWAKRRAIYSNKIGFLGGVNWTILCAFAFKLFPNQTASVLLVKFFWILKSWQWKLGDGTPNPIRIHDAVDPGLNLPEWDANDYRSRFDVMPILTPAYPSMNSSYAVSRSTLNIMQMEFQRGHAKAEKAMATGGKEAWDDLFEESDFFIRFSHYFAITVSAATETNFDSWTGRVGARLRKLVMLLENHQPRGLFQTIFPHPNIFKVESTGAAGEESQPAFQQVHYIGFVMDQTKLPQMGQHPINIEHWTENDVKRWPKRTDDMDVSTNLLTWKQLPEALFTDCSLFKDGKTSAAAIRKERGIGVKKKKKTKQGTKRKAEALASPAPEEKEASAIPEAPPPPPPASDTAPL